MSRSTAVTHHKIRHACLIGILLAFVAVLSVRLTNLHIVERDFLQHQGDARTLRVVNVPANRGLILDRFGEPLAVSTPVDSVWVNPKTLDLQDARFEVLVDLLGLEIDSARGKIESHPGRSFLYLKRHLTPSVAKQVKDLNLNGVYLQPEFKRFYPGGEIGAQMIGFTNIDDQGQEGLELEFNDWLHGKQGQKRIIRDRVGREVEDLGHLQAMEPGRDLKLSLDQRLQYLSYRALQQALEEHQAVSGSVVIVSVKTGEVLAMVNQPSFNPNHRDSGSVHHRRNEVVTDFFEPASAIKGFSLAAVLEQGNVGWNTVVDTSPGVMLVRGGVIRDLHNYGKIDVPGIMQHSSNVGLSKLVLNLPADQLWSMYQRLGFGETTGCGFPGESEGLLRKPHPDRPFVLATMSFGYGVAVTPLQLARAYATLGSEGIKRPVTFLKVDRGLPGERVMSPEVARQVVEILSHVIESGPSNARVPGYHVAGKTGTARKLGQDGYEKGRHRAVFGGLAPAINPEFAIVVTIDEPRRGYYYSNQVAAPVFSKIATGALRLFSVPTDLLESQGVHVAQNGNNHS